jgi:hypothetical protein
MRKLSATIQLKEILRSVLITILLPFGLIFKAFNLRLVYIDESRIGHYFGDSIALLTFFHDTNLIFPIKKPCSPFLTFCIKETNNICTIKSTPIKLIAGWLRNYPIFVLNLSNALNSVHDVHHFKRIIYRPRFKFSELDINFLIDKLQLQQYLNDFRNKFHLTGEKIICFNHRSLEHDRDSGIRHSFRNFNNQTAHALLAELENSSFQVINLSDIVSKSTNVLNLKQHEFSVDDMIFATLICDLYVGDSTGTTVVAQILKINSFVYNIFPRNFEITNTNSIVWPVDYESTNNLQAIDIDQVNLFQTQEDFDLANVRVVAPNKDNVIDSFRNWLARSTYELQTNGLIKNLDSADQR